MASSQSRVLEVVAKPPSRQDRRKAKTRQALLAAAQQLLAAGTTEVSVQEITDAADVGLGSFYNHFSTKAELFRAAIADVLERHGQRLDGLTAELSDPAEVFAVSVRLTGRLIRTHPQIARILARTGLSYLKDADGLAPRALRDIQRGIDTGRFRLANPYVALTTAAGSLVGLLNLWLVQPDLVDDAACDELAEQLLLMFGLPRRTAQTIAHRRLPEESFAGDV